MPLLDPGALGASVFASADVVPQGGLLNGLPFWASPLGLPPSGLLTAGNINLLNRPTVQNPDGSISTVRSISANFGNGEVLLPTISDDGRALSDQEAIDLYRKSGRHLGIFNTPENATAYAERLHDSQADLYRPKHLMGG